jgi:hypothetical protein
MTPPSLFIITQPSDSINSSVTDSAVKSTTNKKLSNNLIYNRLYYSYIQFVGNVKKLIKFQVQYENFSNERWNVTSPNITSSKFDNANNWPWYEKFIHRLP